ncbi:MBL fold metallo-hydrolase [Candidatus Rariloculus sp.]|uniref:MBL fold metallo-hydrolase n=1 Tax=Candidatus Rariloculus sp. TaxID=3101265 RepID=UPI003D12A0A1
MNPHKLLVRRRDLLGSAIMAGVAGSTRLALPGLALLPAAGAGAQESATKLVLLGTQGGPNFNTERGESANAVVVDGETYLVDCGYGTLMALRRAGLNYRDIAQVFLTHLHDDHSGDIAALLSHQWSDGRIEPMTVYGPFGTERMVEAALAFSEANATIRLIDEDRSVEPASIFAGADLEASPEPAEVYADDRVVVSSVENTHFPEASKLKMPYRSLSYRLDSRDRSIAFSGDTGYSEGLVDLASGADVLVCETIEVVAMRQAFERMVAGGAYADNAEGVWAHIVGTHTSTEDAGRMAAEAGVGTLVLSHLVPGALLDVDDETYLTGVRRQFDGEVIVGRDQMVI